MRCRHNKPSEDCMVCPTVRFAQIPRRIAGNSDDQAAVEAALLKVELDAQISVRVVPVDPARPRRIVKLAAETTKTAQARSWLNRGLVVLIIAIVIVALSNKV